MPDLELRAWMESRFDRLDDQMTAAVTKLQEEIATTRHGLRGSVDTMAIQLAEMVTVVRHLETELGELKRRTGDGGPIDERFRRHDQRIGENTSAILQISTRRGTFSWADIGKVIAALAGACTIIAVAYQVATAG